MTLKRPSTNRSSSGLRASTRTWIASHSPPSSSIEADSETGSPPTPGGDRSCSPIGGPTSPSSASAPSRSRWPCSPSLCRWPLRALSRGSRRCPARDETHRGGRCARLSVHERCRPWPFSSPQPKQTFPANTSSSRSELPTKVLAAPLETAQQGEHVVAASVLRPEPLPANSLSLRDAALEGADGDDGDALPLVSEPSEVAPAALLALVLGGRQRWRRRCVVDDQTTARDRLQRQIKIRGTAGRRRWDAARRRGREEAFAGHPVGPAGGSVVLDLEEEAPGRVVFPPTTALLPVTVRQVIVPVTLKALSLRNVPPDGFWPAGLL